MHSRLPKNVKLYYFDITGRAEAIRLLLHMSGVPFQDIRIQRSDWLNKKAEMPFGQVPVLDVDGVIIPQSIAILRYVGTLAGLVPQSPLHEAIVDAVLSVVMDVQAYQFARWHKAPEEEKETVGKNIAEVGLPPAIHSIEEYIKPFETNGFLTGYCTIADILLYQMCSEIQNGKLPYLSSGLPDFNAKYPTILKIMETVGNLPKVQEYNKAHTT